MHNPQHMPSSHQTADSSQRASLAKHDSKYRTSKFLLCCQWCETNPIGASEIQSFVYGMSLQHCDSIGGYIIPMGYTQGAIKEAMNSSSKILLCTDKDVVKSIKLVEANIDKTHHTLNYDDVIIEGLDFENGHIKSIKKIKMRQKNFEPY
ncbi:hypothetical protein F8M41_007967 [Gigaspora margarita]|uniref:Uncharacterized protein n=1 Tax=Gigaspora margarita TaxID=4874 RepID=A0A8H4A4X7_GIGMA|nr:hypothetical protein F8M41_007967 [Gigaspora margarita]